MTPIGLMNIKGLRLGMDVIQISSARLSKRHFEQTLSTKAVLAMRSKGEAFSIVPNRPLQSSSDKLIPQLHELRAPKPSQSLPDPGEASSSQLRVPALVAAYELHRHDKPSEPGLA